MQQIYRRTLMKKCDFNKVAKQFYWNHTSAWVFSCKFAAYFQNTFSSEHLRTAASNTRYYWRKALFQLRFFHLVNNILVCFTSLERFARDKKLTVRINKVGHKVEKKFLVLLNGEITRHICLRRLVICIVFFIELFHTT